MAMLPMGSQHPLSGHAVLVVEDDVETLNALDYLISSVFGCTVLRASSGDEALRIVDSGRRVDVVVTDVVMPQQDGMTLAAQLHKRLPDLPVVLITGRPDVVDALTARGGIALLKPVTIERLEVVLMERLYIARAGYSTTKSLQ
jgi:DNA-binding NtrC family response regulator